jgi:hypothetical protein
VLAEAWADYCLSEDDSQSDDYDDLQREGDVEALRSGLCQPQRLAVKAPFISMHEHYDEYYFDMGRDTLNKLTVRPLAPLIKLFWAAIFTRTDTGVCRIPVWRRPCVILTLATSR